MYLKIPLKKLIIIRKREPPRVGETRRQKGIGEKNQSQGDKKGDNEKGNRKAGARERDSRFSKTNEGSTVRKNINLKVYCGKKKNPPGVRASQQKQPPTGKPPPRGHSSRPTGKEEIQGTSPQSSTQMGKHLEHQNGTAPRAQDD